MIKQNSTIKNFWIIFFACVALVAIAAAVFVGVTYSAKLSQMRMSVVEDENYYKVSEENGFRRSLYAACDSLKNIDANLGKAAISDNAANQAQMLTNVVVHANYVNQNLANLPLAESDNLEACQRFVNQTQDYAAYLLKKISGGDKLSASERAALSNLDEVATNFYDVLQDYAESDAGMFITNGNGLHNNGALSDSLGSVKENTFTYEKLIYDGPFSESVEQKTVKMNKAVSTQEGSAILSKLIGANKFVQKVNSNGVWYSYELPNGRALLACDGRLAQYESYAQSDEKGSPIGKETCIKNAEEFCQKLGYDVKGVWVSKTQEETTYVNCATVTDGVIVYPELIKVAVDSYSGKVVGCEAKAYLINHKDRDVAFGNVSQADAQQKVSAALKVTNVAKALVEKNGKEHLCYEFQCEAGSRQYYVYVDSASGDEVEIFKVIQNTEGYTVM